jgi:Tat protein translocase TatB subunit
LLLFIFQSIGTQELIIIGIVALIFLGPRRLPEYAKKIGKVMADLRSTAGEFKATWEREVNFEEETKALELGSIESEAERSVSPTKTLADSRPPADELSPEVKEIDPEEFESRFGADDPLTSEPDEDIHHDELDKRNWL